MSLAYLAACNRYPKITARCGYWARQLSDVRLVFLVGKAAEDCYPRHLGLTRWTPGERYAEVILSPRLEWLPGDVRDGIIVHELGHVLCGPRRGSYDVVERSADEAAELALGVHISYTEDDLIQTTGPGIRPRPIGLR